MGAGMFHGWEEYFFMLGSAAGGLIGLLFVIVTLTAGRDRSAMERGQKLYMTPLVFHLGGVLLLSGSAIAPAMTGPLYALVSGLAGVIGLVSGVRIAAGISRLPPTTSGGWFDIIWYGIVPAAIYLGLLAAAAAIWMGVEGALAGVAAALMALLLTSMHDAWDLITYLAPRADEPLPLEQMKDSKKN
jgi:hypothetical protein